MSLAPAARRSTGAIYVRLSGASCASALTCSGTLTGSTAGTALTHSSTFPATTALTGATTCPKSLARASASATAFTAAT
jgi:hypothetical protein